MAEISYSVGAGGAADTNGGDSTFTYDGTTYTAGGGVAGAADDPGDGGVASGGTGSILTNGSSGGVGHGDSEETSAGGSGGGAPGGTGSGNVGGNASANVGGTGGDGSGGASGGAENTDGTAGTLTLTVEGGGGGGGGEGIDPDTLGPDLITNGDFGTGDFTGWTVDDGVGGSISIVGGTASINSDQTAAFIRQDILTIGKNYYIEGDISDRDPTFRGKFQLGTAGGGGASPYFTTNGFKTHTKYNVGSTYAFCVVDNYSGGDCRFDNIVVREITGESETYPGGDGGLPGGGGGGSAVNGTGGSGGGGAVVFIYGAGAYDNYEAFTTGSGSWTVPDGVTQVKAVAFGGGGGGHSMSTGDPGGGGSGAYVEMEFAIASSLGGPRRKIRKTAVINGKIIQVSSYLEAVALFQHFNKTSEKPSRKILRYKVIRPRFRVNKEANLVFIPKITGLDFEKEVENSDTSYIRLKKRNSKWLSKPRLQKKESQITLNRKKGLFKLKKQQPLNLSKKKSKRFSLKK